MPAYHAVVDRLPEHVRALVTEIENEIGETGGDDGRAVPTPAEIIEGRQAGPDGRGTAAAGSAAAIEQAVRDILVEIGEDPDRPGLAATPGRVHRMYAELTAGYHVDPVRLVNGAVFDVDYSEMVVVKNIPFYSLCEHHLLPFFGSAAVAYIPRGRVIGLSKIPRIVEMFARRLQVQERMTQQIADFLMETVDPMGVGVVLEATHLCAVMRGVKTSGAVMTTSAVLGVFRRRDRTRAEFFSHLDRRPPGD
jgi:GTP cyclohydrolase I